MADNNEIAAKCFRAGSDAMLRENWDYAIQMFRTSVDKVEDNMLYRQTLRGVEKRKLGSPDSIGKMASMKLMKPRSAIKRARSKKQWADMATAAEDGLEINPWDGQLNADLGEACANLEYLDIAQFAYECAVEIDKQNKDFLRALAKVYASKGQYQQAAGCWHRIYKLDPMDAEARRMSQESMTQDVIETKNYEGADSTKDVMSDHEVAKRLSKTPGKQQAADGPGMSAEADLQRATRKEPENKDNFLKLADFYRKGGRLDEAREQYTKALELSGGDPNIREQIEDVELEQMVHAVEAAREFARKNKDDEEATGNAKKLAAELIKREIGVFQSRVERYPSDLRVKFELAKRFFRIKKYTQAIPLFQQARQDSRLELDALVNLGHCFVQEKKGSLAIRQFEKAIELGINQHDKPDLFKDAHYWAGRLHEMASNNDKAIDYYGEVLALDYEYKDARERLEKLESQ